MTALHHAPPPTEPPFDPDYDRPTDRGRTPIHDVAAEQAVLGALLLDPTHATQLALELNGEDFYRPHHETIWNAAHEVLHEGHALDPVTLSHHLQRTGRLTQIGGATYLADLLTGVPVAANATHYARIVRDCARLRVIAETGAKLTQLGNTADPSRTDYILGEALQVLDDTAMRYGPRDTTNHTGLHDLSWILTGTPPEVPPPTWCRRTDGTALFYAGKVNGIFGDPECGKTWLAQTAIVEALHAGRPAAMIDVDHNGPDHTSARLLLLGATLQQIADPTLFRYYEPEDGDQLHNAITDLVNTPADVLVIDSLGEIFPLLGVNTNDSDELTTAMRQICTRPATAGAAVITIDHLPKSNETRNTGYAIGSIAKKRMIRGAYLRAEARQQPAPGAIGRITLRIEKDTAGELRKSSGGGYAGTLTLDSTTPHITTWTIGRDDSPITSDGTFRPTQLMEKLCRYIEDNDGCTTRDIRDAFTGEGHGSRPKTIQAAIERLVTEGFVSRIPGRGNSKIHHCIALYREAEDDNAE